MRLGIKLLNEGAKMPTKGTKEAACFDLYVSEDTILPHAEGVLVPTGVALNTPEGFCVKVYGRSSLCKRGIQVSTGIIDSDFSNGEIKIQAVNFGRTLPILLKKGERIAQFMVERLEPTEIEQVEKTRETERGGKGFGSTGV
jgi:dUTP pyrophosphatase